MQVELGLNPAACMLRMRVCMVQLLPDDPLLAKLRGEYAAATAAGEKFAAWLCLFLYPLQPLCWG
jgi:hypothetical protein